ncbi:hypothetical protein [Marinifilum flexuosum]|uniref:hypothetical protein n=1 Tax=Marinifilum flexuosum TaxID=1117708 RepID=UPI00249304BA|nr:hypothetical protein [Marinifilum flexuosum]
MKDYEKTFDPSYSFMEKRFGINRSAYHKAIKQLSKLHFIQYQKIKKGNHEYLEIEILSAHNELNNYEMFPSIFIQSPALTHEQKILLSSIWIEMFKDAEQRATYTGYSTNKLFEKNKKIGLSKNIFYRTLNQLTISDSGFVNVFNVVNGTYELNYKVIMSLVNINDLEWADHKGKRSYPEYIEPIVGDFVMCDGAVIDNRENNILNRKKAEEKRAEGVKKRAEGIRRKAKNLEREISHPE